MWNHFNGGAQDPDSPETNRKIKKLEGEMARTLPVPGFAEALRKLKALGHSLHIVTARHERCKGQIIEWLAEQGITVGFGPEDIIAAIWTTNAFGLNPSEPKTTSTESSAKEQGMSDDDEAMEETESEKEKRHNAELQQMFKAQVASGGSGKRKLQVSVSNLRPYSFEKASTGADPFRSFGQSTPPCSSTTITATSSQLYTLSPKSHVFYSANTPGTCIDQAARHPSS